MPRTPSANEYFADFRIARTRLENMAVKAGMDKDVVSNLSIADILKSPRISPEMRKDYLQSQEIGGLSGKDLMGDFKKGTPFFNEDVAEKMMIGRLTKGDQLRKKLESVSPDVRQKAEEAFTLERETMEKGGHQYDRGKKGWWGTSKGTNADREDYFLNRVESIVSDAEKTQKDVNQYKGDEKNKKEFIDKRFTQRQNSFADANAERNDADKEYKQAVVQFVAESTLNAATAVLPAAGAVRAGIGIARGASNLAKAYKAGNLLKSLPGKSSIWEGAKQTGKFLGRTGAEFVATEASVAGLHMADDAARRSGFGPQIMRDVLSFGAGASTAYSENKYGSINREALFKGDILGYGKSFLPTENLQMRANIVGALNPLSKTRLKGLDKSKSLAKTSNALSDTGMNIMQGGAVVANASDAVTFGQDIYSNITDKEYHLKKIKSEIAGKSENAKLTPEQINDKVHQEYINRMGYGATTSFYGGKEAVQGSGYLSKKRADVKKVNSVENSRSDIEAQEGAKLRDKIAEDASSAANPSKVIHDKINSDEYKQSLEKNTENRIQDAKDAHLDRIVKEEHQGAMQHIRGEKTPHEPKEPREPHEPKESRTPHEPHETKESKEPLEPREPRIPKMPSENTTDTYPPIPPALGAGAGGSGTFSSAVGNGFPMQSAPSYAQVNIQLPYFSELGL